MPLSAVARVGKIGVSSERALNRPPALSRSPEMCRLKTSGESDHTLLLLPSRLPASNVENVAVWIFELGDLHADTIVHVALSRHARHLIMLERHAFGLELPHGAVHVIDHLSHRRRFVGSGVLRPVNIDGGAPTSENDQLISFTIDRLETDRVFVELLAVSKFLTARFATAFVSPNMLTSFSAPSEHCSVFSIPREQQHPHSRHRLDPSFRQNAGSRCAPRDRRLIPQAAQFP